MLLGPKFRSLSRDTLSQATCCVAIARFWSLEWRQLLALGDVNAPDTPSAIIGREMAGQTPLFSRHHPLLSSSAIASSSFLPQIPFMHCRSLSGDACWYACIRFKDRHEASKALTGGPLYSVKKQPSGGLSHSSCHVNSPPFSRRTLSSRRR
jgi:hypothetical protein